jgi:TonB family protein
VKAAFFVAIALGMAAGWPLSLVGQVTAPSPALSLGIGASPSPAETLTPGDDARRFVPPKVLKRVTPGYPVLANVNRIEGVVRIRFEVDEAGAVTGAAPVRRQESLLLDDLARDPRLRQWTFQPATLDGKPVPATYEQEFEFRTDPAEQHALAVHRMNLPIGIPDPPYPPAAAARKLHGDITLVIQWTKQGLVDRILLSRSTDSMLLDETAVRFAYANWRVDPALITAAPFVRTIHFAPPP